MSVITTPNMGLVLPVVSSEPGPDWASEINTALGVSGTGVDGHDHTTGKGVKVPSAGLNINADLACGNHRLTGVKGLGLQAQSVAPTSSTGQLHVLTNGSYGDLYYNTGAGGLIALVSSGSIIANSNGFIGDYASNAAAYYDLGTQTFGFYTVSGPTYDISAHANLMAANVSLVRAGATFTLRNASAGSTSGGWKQYATTNNAWYLDVDAGSGYVNVLVAKPSGTTEGLLGVGTTPVTNLHVKNVSGSSNTIGEAFRIESTYSGSTATNFGVAQQFLLKSGAGASTLSGGIQSYWSNVTGSKGGLRLRGASGGSLSSTVAIDISSNAGDTVGIGGVATTGQALTVYGVLAPDGGNTRDFGTTTNYWANTYALNVVPPAINTGSVGTTGLRFQSCWVNSGIFVGGAPGPTTAADLVTRHRANAVVVSGVYSATGVAASLNWNCATDSGHVGTSGTYAIPLTVAVDTDSAILVTLISSHGEVKASFGSTTQINVATYDDGGLASDRSFSIAVIGKPSSNP